MKEQLFFISHNFGAPWNSSALAAGGLRKV
jgi:hypothetical protein